MGKKMQPPKKHPVDDHKREVQKERDQFDNSQTAHEINNANAPVGGRAHKDFK